MRRRRLTVMNTLADFEHLEATMTTAIVLIQFYLDEAVRLLDTGFVRKDIREAELLRTWLCEIWGEGMINTSAVVNRGPNSLRTAPKVKQLIGILEEHGWLEQLSGNHEVNGRKTKQAWRVVRGSCET